MYFQASNEISHNREFGVHVTRLRTDKDVTAEQLRRTNTLTVNGMHAYALLR